MADRVHLFGIRHHGPGSARSLERALDALDPASVLIEGPPEADAVLPFADEDMVDEQFSGSFFVHGSSLVGCVACPGGELAAEP